jgi:hypothetical protein
MKLWKSMFDPTNRQAIINRLQTLQPDAQRRWGTMSAPQMICHLSDQMRHALRLSPVESRPGPLRLAVVRWASIYVLRWPKGRIKGPPEAYSTEPETHFRQFGV